MQKIIRLSLIILIILLGCQSVISSNKIELKTGVNLGDGAGEIADILADRLKGQAFFCSCFRTFNKIQVLLKQEVVI